MNDCVSAPPLPSDGARLFFNVGVKTIARMKTEYALIAAEIEGINGAGRVFHVVA